MIQGYDVLAELTPTRVGRAFMADLQGTRVVVEVFNPVHALQGRFMRTLESERSAATAFRHSGAPRVLQVHAHPPEIYLVSEYVPGIRLNHLLEAMRSAQQSLPWRVALAVGIQLAGVLQAAHGTSWGSRGPMPLYHGAICPSDVLIGLDGRALLLGLGTGRARATVSPRVEDLSYRPPESLAGRALSGSADVYGLGLVIYELLGGGRAFERSSPQATRQAVTLEPLPALADLSPDAPKDIEDLLFAMCRKLPGERPQDIGAVLAKLKGSLPEDSVPYEEQLLRLVHMHCGPRVRRVQALCALRPPSPPSPSSGADPSPTEAPVGPQLLSPGALVADRYRVIEVLGQGGAAIVYRVEHVSLGRQFALKVLRAELSDQPSLLERFRREAQAIGRLDHPNIVRVSDFGQTPDGALFTVMQLVEGASMQDILRKLGTLDPFTALEIAKELLCALDCAHGAGVVHRDIKPDNIMLTTEQGRLRVRLVDFGIAQQTMYETPGPRLTRSNVLLGTPLYMAPEQAVGDPVDHRADLYSVGVVLYEALSGRPPFVGETTVAILSQALTEPPPKFEIQAQDGLRPAQLWAVIDRALSKEPEQRFGTAGEFIEALEGCGRGPEGV